MSDEHFIVNNLSHSEMGAHQFFWKVVADQKLMFNYKQFWITEEVKGDFITLIKQFGTLINLDTTSNNVSKEVVIQYPSSYVHALIIHEVPSRYLSIHIATRAELTDKEQKNYFDALKNVFPVAQPAQDNQVQIAFCSVGSSHGCRITNRDIDIQPWVDISDNYTTKVSAQLDKVIKTFQPGKGGQLILWHGAPGTGKTFALRALCHGWKNWCDSYYVLDPEVFFGDAGYMLELIMHETYDLVRDSLIGDSSPAIKTKWKLLILEDAGELLTSDARERTGQGLARLLNTVDGLIGQGLKLLVLITTNEALQQIHPAVARPGRCASEIFFKSFTALEAKEWMLNANLDEQVAENKDYTLAELFASKEGFVGAKGQPADRKPFGFNN